MSWVDGYFSNQRKWRREIGITYLYMFSANPPRVIDCKNFEWMNGLNGCLTGV